jgi:uncharacterized protein (DUF1800 family)
MRPTRREFLAMAGGLSALALTGCPAKPLRGLLPPAKPATTFGAPPSGHTIDAATHALNRLTFGPGPGDYARVTGMGVDAFIDEQLAPESIDDAWCAYQVRRIETLALPPGELFEYKREFLLRELTRGKIVRAVHSRRQLHEVMADFWGDHFNVDMTKGDCPWLNVACDREVIRRHAMTTFQQLLRASALSPAMLWYLDGRMNRRDTPSAMPNENYARELLELHTLGVHGGYTQQDVMEVARCLTGWYVRSEEMTGKGRVEFHPEWHDNGPKAVLGSEIPAGLGRGDLERVLGIVALHPATAGNIARKLCTCFICEEPPPAAVDSVAAAFLSGRGAIRPTLRALFDTPAFRESTGQCVKRPFRFVVSALRVAGAETDGGGDLGQYLGRMGHAPYLCPTPDGYPLEPAPWTGTLLWRWHFAEAFARNAVAGARADWTRLTSELNGMDALAAHFLGRLPNEEERAVPVAAGMLPAALMASPAFQRH